MPARLCAGGFKSGVGWIGGSQQNVLWKWFYSAGKFCRNTRADRNTPAAIAATGDDGVTDDIEQMKREGAGLRLIVALLNVVRNI